ncbi:uncharacterized protein LOC109838074 isoform X2 [Asparagus officinalis]|uniref:uncharacterized protein LOC109838074 isoform X2 n=1 Tax=Asparagus officinalis TaxID=4686 RepID=UPI00098E40EC|nr:uncharacterized protein LOC109838074 isoform X2 [Asparagus officinalis]XP_020262128.1 uncharacterized protein LOC109838074 isoform X2 [Asparagus officinalis]
MCLSPVQNDREFLIQHNIKKRQKIQEDDQATLQTYENRPAASSKMLAVENLRTFTASFKGNGYGRRSLLSLVLLSTASTTSNASDSRTTLLQEYIKKSKENKARNDKEGLILNKSQYQYKFS